MDFSNSCFWFSWFPSTGTVSPSERVMLEAAESALKLITKNDLTSHLRRLGDPQTLLKAIPNLLASLKKSSQQCLVFGTLCPEQATRCSWDTLGLDLFSVKSRAGPARDEFLFKYVPLLSLTRLIEDLAIAEEALVMEDGDLLRIRTQLQLAKCFNWLQQKRTCVGHGQRDRMQFQRPSHKDFTKTKEATGERNCPTCPAIIQLQKWSAQLETIEGQTDANDAYIPLVKNLANLDCQTTKFSSLLSYFPSAKSYFPFDRIVIFEDDQRMKEHVILSFARLMDKSIRGLNRLAEAQFKWNGESRGPYATIDKNGPDCFIIRQKHKDGDDIRCLIECADAFRSQKEKTFVRSDGEPVDISYDIDEQLRTLYCFDIEVADPSAPGKLLDINGISPGLWFLYKCAVEAPLASRLVITGYRSHDERSFQAGAGSLLMKPFRGVEFENAIRAARSHRVLWLSPRDVWDEWRDALKKCSYPLPEYEDHPLLILRAWLEDRNILLEFENRLPDFSGESFDLVVMDPLPLQEDSHIEQLECTDFPEYSKVIEERAKAITKLISHLRLCANQPRLAVLLPLQSSTLSPRGAIHKVSRMLLDGKDRMIHKPIHVLGDSRFPQHEPENIGQHLISMYASQPHFDTKYVVITPLMGLVWAKSHELFFRLAPGVAIREFSAHEVLVGWSAFGVLMGEIWGFGFRPGDICSDATASLELVALLDKEFDRNSKRWKGFRSPNATKIVDLFLQSMRAPENWIGRCQTVEVWLRRVLDTDLKDIRNRSSFADDLVRLFGGETKFSFGSRGGWFDKGKYIEDVPLVIEFCAKRGIIAREAIKEVVVNYLTDHGSEEAVLFQEIPIEGHLKFGKR